MGNTCWCWIRDRKSTRLNSSHRALHSFPTRRSSDLGIAIARHKVLAFMISAAMMSVAGTFYGQYVLVLDPRSEEHTSELQSPSSTLFPYTTLFRSRHRDCAPQGAGIHDLGRHDVGRRHVLWAIRAGAGS